MLLTTVPPPALTVVIIFQFSLTGEHRTQNTEHCSKDKISLLYQIKQISIVQLNITGLSCLSQVYKNSYKCVIKSFSRKDQSFPQNLSQSALFKLNEGNCFSH